MDPLLIFDTHGGLCNQFYDIMSGIIFCVKHKLPFTFRHCSFRNDNLNTWTNQPFDKLFDLKVFDPYPSYVQFDDIKDKLTTDNCFNLHDNRIANSIFNDTDILTQIRGLKKKYVVLKMMWAIYNPFDEPTTIHHRILPSKHIMKKYNVRIMRLLTDPYTCMH